MINFFQTDSPSEQPLDTHTDDAEDQQNVNQIFNILSLTGQKFFSAIGFQQMINFSP